MSLLRSPRAMVGGHLSEQPPVCHRGVTLGVVRVAGGGPAPKKARAAVEPGAGGEHKACPALDTPIALWFSWLRRSAC